MKDGKDKERSKGIMYAVQNQTEDRVVTACADTWLHITTERGCLSRGQSPCLTTYRVLDSCLPATS